MDSPKLPPHGPLRPEIDGLRAVAVLPVVLYHAGLGCPGGFSGVDVFFVISGFLIGGIILRELEEGTFHFGRFWERRARRIAPAMLCLLGVTLLAGMLVLAPTERAGLGAQTISALLGVANFKMLSLTGGYWALGRDDLALLHTWSLAVEEQFYLLLPVLLVVLWRFSRRAVWPVLTVLFAASFCLSLYGSEDGYAGNFYLLPSRAWELLAGVLAVAVGSRQGGPSRRVAEVLGWVGLGLVLVSVCVFHEDARWPDLRTLAPVMGTLLVLLAVPPEGQTTSARRFLSLRPLRAVGLISYSLYLWHWPLLVFLRQSEGSAPPLALRWEAVAVSVPLALASWRFVELPFRNKLGRFRVRLKPLLIGVGTVWLCLMAASWRLAPKPGGKDLPMPSFIANTGPKSIWDYDAGPRLAEGGILFNANASNHAPRCLVVGSSHAVMLGPVIEALSDQFHVPCALLGQGGVSPIFSGPTTESRLPRKVREKRRGDELKKKFIAQWQPDLIIVAAKWNLEMNWSLNPDLAWPDFADGFSNTVVWLKEHGGRVVILAQVPELPIAQHEDLRAPLWRDYQADGHVLPRLLEPPEVTAQRRADWAVLQTFAASNVIALDPAPIFLNADGSVRYSMADGILYFNDNHLSALGALELKPLLAPFFQSLAP